MPGIRSLARSVVVVACIVIAIFVVALIQNAFACPVRLTPTLRKLVLNSDRIVVATIGESLDIETKQLENNYTYTLKRVLLNVSSTAKGDAHEATVYVFYPTWRNETGGYSIDSFSEKGKPHLLFLTRREQGDGYELADMAESMKELADEDMKVYLRRIEELVAIMRQPKPEKREIVEWLVRCAEEPATRWHGAVELAMSAEMQADAEQKAASKSPQATVASDDDEDADDESDDESSSDSSEEVSLDGPYYYADADVDPTYAAALTGEHKDRLAAALVSLQEIEEKDMPLVGLLERWKDARLTPFIVARIRQTPDEPAYIIEELMMTLARLRGDKELARLAQDYGNSPAPSDENNAAAGESAENDAAQQEPEAAEAAPTEAGVEATASEVIQITDLPLKRTKVQRRSDLLLRFIARVENAAQPETASLEARPN